jgi:hypothetical protein
VRRVFLLVRGGSLLGQILPLVSKAICPLPHRDELSRRLRLLAWQDSFGYSRPAETGLSLNLVGQRNRCHRTNAVGIAYFEGRKTMQGPDDRAGSGPWK